MIRWLIPVVYLLGTLVGARVWLRSWMENVVCSGIGRDQEFLSFCRANHVSKCAQPRGETRDRRLADGILALVIGLAWPLILLAQLVVRSTPASPAEARYKLRTQQEEIAELQAANERLMKQIGVNPHG